MLLTLVSLAAFQGVRVATSTRTAFQSFRLLLELILAAWTVNLLGIDLLIDVGRVAIMSSPVPFGWNVEPPLLLAAYLPYALIVPVCVGGALAGHVLPSRASCPVTIYK